MNEQEFHSLESGDFVIFERDGEVHLVTGVIPKREDTPRTVVTEEATLTLENADLFRKVATRSLGSSQHS
jgi:hypothetical protein